MKQNLKIPETLTGITYCPIMEEYCFEIKSHKGRFTAFYSNLLKAAIVHKTSLEGVAHTAEHISALRLPKGVLEAIEKECEWIFAKDELLETKWRL